MRAEEMAIIYLLPVQIQLLTALVNIDHFYVYAEHEIFEFVLKF